MYQKGIRFERDIQKFLAEKGFTTVRSAGSHGKWDVIGYKNDIIIAVQAKNLKNSKHMKYKMKGCIFIDVYLEKKKDWKNCLNSLIS